MARSEGLHMLVSETLRESIEHGFSLPTEWYTNPAIFDLELTAVFERHWHYAGHESEVAEAGQFFTCKVGRIPVVVTRTTEGRLRAFVNVCRHRLHEVVQGRGRRKTLQCPYHGWTYDLDGSLRSAPRCELDEGFDKSLFSLNEIQIESAGPLLFVNIDSDADPLPDAIREYPALCEARGLNLEAPLRRTITYDVACNWKVAVEGNECYHCACIHPQFAKKVHTEPEIMKVESYGDEVFGFTSRYRGTAAPHGGTPDFQIYYIWPNLFIGQHSQSDSDSGFLALVYAPVDVTSTRFDTSYFLPTNVGDEVVDAAVAASAEIADQDIAALESVQRGHSAGVVQQARFMMPSELAVRALNQRVYDAVHQTTREIGIPG